MIDIREEIAGAPIGGYHRFLALLIGMVVFFDGYDTFNPAYVIHYVAKPWHLAPGQAGLLVSSGLIGFMIGALLQGKFSDRYGRRATLLVALWIVTAFSLATAVFGNSFFAFCALRLLTGSRHGCAFAARRDLRQRIRAAPPRQHVFHVGLGVGVGHRRHCRGGDWGLSHADVWVAGVVLRRFALHCAGCDLPRGVARVVAIFGDARKLAGHRASFVPPESFGCRALHRARPNVHVSGAERPSGLGLAVVVPSLPADDAVRVGFRILHPVCNLGSLGLGSHRDDAARRGIRDEL